MIINGHDVVALMETADLAKSSMAKKLGISNAALDKALEAGIEEPNLRRRFLALKADYEERDAFSVEYILELQRRLRWDDADVCIVLGLSPSNWVKLKQGAHRVSPQIRKLCKLIEWFEAEGFDPYQHIGMS